MSTINNEKITGPNNFPTFILKKKKKKKKKIGNISAFICLHQQIFPECDIPKDIQNGTSCTSIQK